MKKIFLAVVLAFALFAGANAQLLYKVSGNALSKPSYIVGTYHLAPASFVKSIPGALAAIDEADVVCGEVVMSEMNGKENKEKVMEAMYLPKGQTIADILTPDEMEKLNSFMKRTLGLSFKNPIIMKQMGNMSPMSIETLLSVSISQKLVPDYNPLKLIDEYFQKQAKKRGKTVAGLESVDFQLATLYKGTSIERQKEQLMCLVENEEYNMMIAKQLADAYFSQDLDALYAVTQEKMNNSCDSTPEEDERLIYNRNAAWAEKMPTIMAEHPTLFVVGASHLPGERGVLELLKQRGYIVEPVLK